MKFYGTMGLIFLSFIFISGCTRDSERKDIQEMKNEIIALKKSVESFEPDLGDIMVNLHLHHAKLYFSGQNENWELASYQLDEIKEGLHKVEELHEHFKELKNSPKNLRHLTDQGLTDIEAAIKEKNKSNFMAGFKHLTVSCNQCHQATGHAFIVVQVPTAIMFSNQNFSKTK
jgi:uncharacterized protein (DUF2225 family)